jgi:Holliday junction resolvase RusA-like endonuclease
MIKFEIPYPPTKKGKAAWNKRFGLNAYYAGKHWSARKRDAEELHTLTILCMRKCKIAYKPVSGPVEVRFKWNDGLDVDNHAALGKAIVDAMKGYLLPDDNREWFKKVSHEFWDGDCILIEILPYRGEGHD